MTVAQDTDALIRSAEPTLREVVEALCEFERGPGSAGEEDAARWLAHRLARVGCEAHVEEASFHEGYADLVGLLAATGALGGMIVRNARYRGSRRFGGTLAALATALIADDISNGLRLARRARPARHTQNVVALCGDRSAERTLVVLAHHDAAPTGLIFDDRLQRVLCDLAPGLFERIDTSLPIWWPVLGGPGAVALAAVLGPGAGRWQRALLTAGTLVSTGAAVALADIARSPIVPGANDNASAVAVQVALAERLATVPLEGLRVLLVSCGAEEVIQGGIYSFAETHFPQLDRDQTWFLTLDTVGSPKLVMLEGEGPVVMEDYFDRGFRDLVARVADRVGAPIRRGMRARNSTDAVIPSRAGYPTATLASIDRYKALSNYHTINDTPENLDYRTVAQALLVTEAVARELAANPWIGG